MEICRDNVTVDKALRNLPRSGAANLDSSIKGELLARNPCRVSAAWKRRVNAFMDFICFGKSKPIGQVRNYAINCEWQTRCSEHVHKLFWCDKSVPSACYSTDTNGATVLVNGQEIIKAAECCIGASVLPLDRKNNSFAKGATTFDALKANPRGDLGKMFKDLDLRADNSNLIFSNSTTPL